MTINEQIQNVLPSRLQEAYASYQAALPDTPIDSVESKLRDISPFFLGEFPSFDSGDSFLNKCKKMVSAVTNLISYITNSETRNLVRFKPLAREVTSAISEKIALIHTKDSTSAQLDQANFRKEYHRFHYEFVKRQLDKSEGSSVTSEKKFIKKFTDAFSDSLKNRKSIYFKNKLHTINKEEDRTQLVERAKEHYAALYKSLDSSIAGLDEDSHIFQKEVYKEHMKNSEIEIEDLKNKMNHIEGMLKAV